MTLATYRYRKVGTNDLTTVTTMDASVRRTTEALQKGRAAQNASAPVPRNADREA